METNIIRRYILQAVICISQISDHESPARSISGKTQNGNEIVKLAQKTAPKKKIISKTPFKMSVISSATEFNFDKFNNLGFYEVNTISHSLTHSEMLHKWGKN